MRGARHMGMIVGLLLFMGLLPGCGVADFGLPPDGDSPGDGDQPSNGDTNDHPDGDGTDGDGDADGDGDGDGDDPKAPCDPGALRCRGTEAQRCTEAGLWSFDRDCALEDRPCRNGVCVSPGDEDGDGDGDGDVDPDGDADPDGDEDGDVPDGDTDADEDGDTEDDGFPWALPKALPWMVFPGNDYDPQNPDPDCEEDAYYPDNSTPEGAIALNDGDRYANMAVCEVGAEDWYTLDLPENTVAYMMGRVLSYAPQQPGRIKRSAIAPDWDYNWAYLGQVFRFEESGYYVRRRLRETSPQRYNFSLDFAPKYQRMPETPSPEVLLPSGHYLHRVRFFNKPSVPRLPSCLAEIENPYALDGEEYYAGYIALSYQNAAKNHTFDTGLLHSGTAVALLAHCAEDAPELSCHPLVGSSISSVRMTFEGGSLPGCLLVGAYAVCHDDHKAQAQSSNPRCYPGGYDFRLLEVE